jgi:hypothetical protein
MVQQTVVPIVQAARGADWQTIFDCVAISATALVIQLAKIQIAKMGTEITKMGARLEDIPNAIGIQIAHAVAEVYREINHHAVKIAGLERACEIHHGHQQQQHDTYGSD